MSQVCSVTADTAEERRVFRYGILLTWVCRNLQKHHRGSTIRHLYRRSVVLKLKLSSIIILDEVPILFMTNKCTQIHGRPKWCFPLIMHVYSLPWIQWTLGHVTFDQLIPALTALAFRTSRAVVGEWLQIVCM